MRSVGLQRAISEDQLQDAIVECARTFGWLAYHTYDSRRSAKGFPDLVLVKPPRVIFAELKTETGEQSPAQLTWEGALEGCDVEVYLWRPSGWLDGSIEALLRQAAAVRRTA